MTNSKYGKIIAIASSVCIVLLGIAFIISCAHLFFTADDVAYSRERVGEYLLVLAIPSFITIALTVCGFIYSYINAEKVDETTERTPGELLESFASRFDFQSFNEETKNAVLKIRKRRNIIDFIASEFSALCFVLIIDYFLFIAKFSVESLNADMASAFAFCLPIATLAVAIHIPRLYLSEKSAKEELAILKAGAKGASLIKKENCKKALDKNKIAGYAVACVAIVLIVIGIINGGMDDVFGKAIRICTECIGLG
jgi:uncharacterized membrane protein